MKIVEPSVELWSMTNQPLELIERAGRVCYQSEPKGNAAAFVQMLIKRGHDSVLEHASATFSIVCDRGVTHETVRHRIASYSQESTRYVKYDEIAVIEPPGLDEPARQAWLASCQAAGRSYCDMLSQGVKPQMARSVLPTCLKTQIVMTANFREWRHFLKLRLSAASHPQMRQVAAMILASLLGSPARDAFIDIS